MGRRADRLGNTGNPKSNMAKKQAAPPEVRLTAIEARLSRLEALLKELAKSPGGYLVAPGPGDAITITLHGLGPRERAVPKKVERHQGLEGQTAKETPVPPWEHLVAREHPWRKQLFLKGRNMPVRQLVNSAKVNKLTHEQAAANYRLPVEAIREAFAYAAENAELLELEAAQEKYILARGRKGRASPPVS
jgi:uncharacterized protein (DUF433 family)